MNELKCNADRFAGFADIYDYARPRCPEKVIDYILRYMGRKPSVVVDIGCGTGLSTFVWSQISDTVIGMDPSEDMLAIARQKSEGYKNVSFILAFSDRTGLDDNFADIVTCSQSFHWMNPETTLKEAARILKEGGIFAAYDCDWPPVCGLEAEYEYNALFRKVKEIEDVRPELRNRFKSWPKEEHLMNIKKSGLFRYAREIVFSASEECDAARFINIAFSQGSLQSILKSGITEIEPCIKSFTDRIESIFGNEKFTVDFCYRMRIGIK